MCPAGETVWEAAVPNGQYDVTLGLVHGSLPGSCLLQDAAVAMMDAASGEVKQIVNVRDNRLRLAGDWDTGCKGFKYLVADRVRPSQSLIKCIMHNRWRDSDQVLAMSVPEVRMVVAMELQARGVATLAELKMKTDAELGAFCSANSGVPYARGRGSLARLS